MSERLPHDRATANDALEPAVREQLLSRSSVRCRRTGIHYVPTRSRSSASETGLLR